jgi:hypothetical protein
MQQSTISINDAWPTTMFLCDWPGNAARAPAIIDDLLDRAKAFKTPIASGVATSAKSATGLIESPLNLFSTTKEPNLQALVAWISGCVRAAVSQVNGGAVAPDKLRVEFTESWFHITNDGGFHDAHTHGNCSWCGIYYLAAGDPDTVPASGATKAGNGVNRFYGPLPKGGMLRDYGNNYLRRYYVDVQPIEGRLVLFPSYLMHSALPYAGAADRIVLAFNTQTFTA